MIVRVTKIAIGVVVCVSALIGNIGNATVAVTANPQSVEMTTAVIPQNGDPPSAKVVQAESLYNLRCPDWLSWLCLR